MSWHTNQITCTYQRWRIFRSFIRLYFENSKKYSTHRYPQQIGVQYHNNSLKQCIDSKRFIRFHSPSCSVVRQVSRRYATSSSGTELISPNIQDVKQFLTERQIKFEQGHACLTLCCPNLKVTSEKKAAKLFINEITGYFYCDACKKRGTWFELKDSIHSLSLQKKSKTSACFKEDSKRIDTNSVQFDDCFRNCIPLIDLCGDEYDAVISSFGLEGLKSPTLSNFAVEFEKTSNSLILPAFAFDSTLLSLKKLTCKIQEDGTWSAPKESCTPRSGLSGLFGWNLARSSSKEVVFAPSEKDAMIVYQETKIPAVALPKGNSTLPQEVLPQLEQFKKIILWFGNDLQAWNTAKRFAKKLGEKRCYVIRPSNEEPCPYEALKQNLNFKQILAKAKRINHEAILSFSHLRQEVFSEITQPDQVKGVKWQRYPAMTQILKGHRQGELTIFTGPTGSGKTTFMSEYSLDLCMQGVNTLWGSFEIQNVRLAKKMLFQFARVNFTEHPEQFENWADHFENLPLHFMAFHGSVGIRKVIETMEHAVDVHDIEHVIVDNLQFMMGLDYGAQGDRFLKQDMIIAKFRKFATNKNCHVTLVIHPRKEKETEALTTASIFGSAKATQEADNVMLLQDKRLQSPRDDRKYIQITKNRFDGDLGIVELNFDKDTFCYTRDNRETVVSEPELEVRHDSVADISHKDHVNKSHQIDEDSIDKRHRIMYESLQKIIEQHKWSSHSSNPTSIEQIAGNNILIPVDMTEDCDL